MSDFLQKIIDIDNSIWHWVNVAAQNAAFDWLMPLLRNPIIWSPLYLFLLIFIPYRFGRCGFYWCAAFILTFALADYSSASIIKPMVMRLRPCNEPLLQSIVHLIVPCGSGYSFPSTHATNHFAFALFMIFTLGHHFRWIKAPLLIWAFSIAYAQVYVGVHYPFDVLCGALLGATIGSIVGRIFHKKLPLGTSENRTV